MKKILFSLVAIVFIMPQSALASWWNPFSWFKKTTSQTTQQTQTRNFDNNRQATTTVTGTASEIEKLQKRIDDLKKQKSPLTSPIKTSVINKKTEKTAPAIDNSEVIKAQVQAQVEATLKAKAERDALVAKQKADEQVIIKAVKAESDRQIAQQIEAQQWTIQQAAQAKQEKLNAINRQIADLNAKYVVDFAAAGQAGDTQSFADGMQRRVTNQYNIDYATLMAQFQQIQYGN